MTIVHTALPSTRASIYISRCPLASFHLSDHSFMSWTASSKGLSITGALGGEFQKVLIKTPLFSAEIMSHSNVKLLRLSWIGFTPICPHFVTGVVYCETVGNWTSSATAVIHPQSYIDQILILFHSKCS